MTEENSFPERALAVLKELLRLAEFDVAVSIGTDNPPSDAVNLIISGPDAQYLVGPRGQYIDALQLLLSPMVSHTRELRPRLIIDADGYRAKRTATLVRFALELADQVAATGQEAVTDPLNPMERRIVHTALESHPDVTTYSEGMEPDRYVVVTMRA